MQLDWSWILIGLPIAFGLGWLASRLDLRQWRRTDRDAPKAYFKGLNLLLNEQTDKAIDAFIEAVQADPDTSELHFALGNLFRRRGEFERAVRVHEHLLQRGDLAAADRQRAQHALAQDFVAAGLLDRAEAAFKALEGTPYATEARLARLALHERARDWRAAAEIASALEKSGAGSFATRISHYHAELALEADDRGDAAAADAEMARALAAAPNAPRALTQQAQRLTRQQRLTEAWSAWNELRHRCPEAFARVAPEYALAARAAGHADAARAALTQAFERTPGIDLLRALAALEDAPAGASPRLGELLAQQPSLSATLEWLTLPGETAAESLRPRVRDAVAQAARAQQRYRCAACGFESQRHFWQCPGCLSWDSFPPTRIEEQ